MSGSDNTNLRYPPSTFSAEYPYNQATVTRGGHEIHINDTPDNESLRIAHTKGTYVEIEKTGRWKHTVVEKVYNYFKNTFTQTVDSHADIKVGGTYTFNVDKSSYEAVALDKTTAVGQNLLDVVSGVRQVHTRENRNESVSGSASTLVDGNLNTQVNGSMVTNIGGQREDIVAESWLATGRDFEMSTLNDFTVQCNNFNVKARQNVSIEALGQIEINATGSITIQSAAGPITVTASGVVYVNGTQIRLND